MQRRTFITGALTGTAALALGVSLMPSDEVSLAENNLHRLTLSILIPVFLDGALADVPSQREIAINRTVDAIFQAINYLDEEQQQEINQLLDMLESRLGLLLLTGSITQLMLRQPNELVELLEYWRSNFLVLLQTAYTGLRELILSSYYSCPEHWGRIMYTKPSFLIPAN